MFKKTTTEQLSVRQLEELAKTSTATSDQKSTSKINDSTSIELERIRKEISALIGTKVDISRNNKGQGKIVIAFANDRQFNDIYDLLRDIDKN
jgi:ParB family transcriptional regulator, chromosome partitioning protein